MVVLDIVNLRQLVESHSSKAVTVGKDKHKITKKNTKENM
jgi:hypothetical protein